jgi:hypothetical protein
VDTSDGSETGPLEESKDCNKYELKTIQRIEDPFSSGLWSASSGAVVDLEDFTGSGSLMIYPELDRYQG